MIEEFQPSGRVVITGIGAVTPLGNSIQETWDGLLSGKSGVAPITLLDATDYPTRIAAEVKGFNAEDWLDKKDARRIDRFIYFAVAASRMAYEDSGINPTAEERDHFGVLVGSGIGGLNVLAEQHRRQIEGGPGKISPFLVPYMIPDMASGYVSIQLNLRGPNTCVVTACSTGANAVGDAYHMIKRGDAIAMIAGGSEAPINELGLGGFCAARAMTTNNDNPSKASRPFDKDRDGFVMGEGAAVMVMEDYDYALKRGARIYGEIIGYGMSGDAHHITDPAPDGNGATRSMKMALRTAKIKPEDVDYINAHGTSTPKNDRGETLAVKNAFGDHAYKVPMSSTKSMTGHLLGAAGSIEAAICLLTMHHGIIPPTINLDEADPECDLDYVPHVPREQEVNIAFTNSFGFGGHNVSLVFRKV